MTEQSRDSDASSDASGASDQRVVDEERAERLQQRKIRNRISASESRMRKLDYYKELEDSHSALVARLARVEAELESALSDSLELELLVLDEKLLYDSDMLDI
jgi:hypothetical protein